MGHRLWERGGRVGRDAEAIFVPVDGLLADADSGSELMVTFET